MSDQKPLSGAEREAFARELTDEQLEITPAVEKPSAILTAGQPGSGKGRIVEDMRLRFNGIGASAFEVDADEVRPQLPYVKSYIASGDLNLPPAAYVDAGTIGARMMEMAADAKRNIIYDGTLSNTQYAMQNVAYLKDRDYRIEIHGMAVPPDLSHASTYGRREVQIERSATNFGRGVDDEFHDQSVEGLVKTIDALQADGKVDAIVLYDRQGNVVGRTHRDGDRWVPDEKMADTLRDAHQHPDQRSLNDAAMVWGNAAELMRSRDADPDEQRKIDGFRDEAAARAAQRAAATPAERAAQFDAACAAEVKAIVEKAVRIGTRLEERREELQGRASATEAAKPSAPRWMPGAGKAAGVWEEKRERIDRQIAATTARIERVAPYMQPPVPGYPSLVEAMAVKNVERRDPGLAREAVAFRAAERQAQARAFTEAKAEQQNQAKKLSR